MLKYFCLDRGVKIKPLSEEEQPLWEGKVPTLDIAKSTPLMAAVLDGKEDVALLLLELHQQQQQQQQFHAAENILDLSRLLDDKGDTLLHYTASYHFPRLASALLMEHGTSLDLKNIYGQTALDVAIGLNQHVLMHIFWVHHETQRKLGEAIAQKTQGEKNEEKEEEGHRLVEWVDQAAQAEEAILVQLETEIKEEDEKRKEKRKETSMEENGGKKGDGGGKEEGGRINDMEKETKLAVAAALTKGEEDDMENVSGQGSK